MFSLRFEWAHLISAQRPNTDPSFLEKSLSLTTNNRMIQKVIGYLNRTRCGLRKGCLSSSPVGYRWQSLTFPSVLSSQSKNVLCNPQLQPRHSGWFVMLLFHVIGWKVFHQGPFPTCVHSESCIQFQIYYGTAPPVYAPVPLKVFDCWLAVSEAELHWMLKCQNKDVDKRNETWDLFTDLPSHCKSVGYTIP